MRNKRNTQCCPSGRKPKRGDALLPKTERQFSIPPKWFPSPFGLKHCTGGANFSAEHFSPSGQAMALLAAPPSSALITKVMVIDKLTAAGLDDAQIFEAVRFKDEAD